MGADFKTPSGSSEINNNLTEVQKSAQEYIDANPLTKWHVHAKGFTDKMWDTFYTVQWESGDESAFSIASILWKLNLIEEYSTIANMRFAQSDSKLSKWDILRLKVSWYEDNDGKDVWELQIQKD